jgi:hypothetical protein
MIEMTGQEIVQTLFKRQESNAGRADPRVEVLVAMVFDLMMEVRALRETLIRSSLGAGGKDSVFGKVYRDTALLTHNSAGISSGLMKLLFEFYTRDAEAGAGSAGERRIWRECLLLHRLGFSEEEIHRYKEEALEAETFT